MYISAKKKDQIKQLPCVKARVQGSLGIAHLERTVQLFASVAGEFLNRKWARDAVQRYQDLELPAYVSLSNFSMEARIANSWKGVEF